MASNSEVNQLEMIDDQLMEIVNKRSRNILQKEQAEVVGKMTKLREKLQKEIGTEKKVYDHTSALKIIRLEWELDELNEKKNAKLLTLSGVQNDTMCTMDTLIYGDDDANLKMALNSEVNQLEMIDDQLMEIVNKRTSSRNILQKEQVEVVDKMTKLIEREKNVYEHTSALKIIRLERELDELNEKCAKWLTLPEYQNDTMCTVDTLNYGDDDANLKMASNSEVNQLEVSFAGADFQTLLSMDNTSTSMLSSIAPLNASNRSDSPDSLFGNASASTSNNKTPQWESEESIKCKKRRKSMSPLKPKRPAKKH